MKKLTLESLRHMIREELANLLTDDAFFNKEDLTNTGTGAILQLSDLYDEESDDEEFEGGECNICGGSHAIESPCAQHDEEMEVSWTGPDGSAEVPDISNLPPDEAFALGLKMGQSGEFDDD